MQSFNSKNINEEVKTATIKTESDRLADSDGIKMGNIKSFVDITKRTAVLDSTRPNKLVSNPKALKSPANTNRQGSKKAWSRVEVSVVESHEVSYYSEGEESEYYDEEEEKNEPLATLPVPSAPKQVDK